MTTTVIRLALLSMIIVIAAIRMHAVKTRDALDASFDVDLSVKSLIESQGLTLKTNPKQPPNILSAAVYFQRPDCAEPSVVIPFSLNFEALPLLARIVSLQSYTQTFHYLSGKWPTQNRARMFIEWFKHAVLEVTDNTSYLPVKTAVVLAEPLSCHSPTLIDWRLIWDKERNKAAAQRCSLTCREEASKDGS